MQNESVNPEKRKSPLWTLSRGEPSTKKKDELCGFVMKRKRSYKKKRDGTRKLRGLSFKKRNSPPFQVMANTAKKEGAVRVLLGKNRQYSDDGIRGKGII